jgi:hypothetical protein
VYGALKKLADPFVDTPNTVLRRLLNLDRISPKKLPTVPRSSIQGSHQVENGEIRSKQFVEKVLAREFGRDFKRRGRFVYMLESRNRLVYFQNFNAAYENAWYRIGASARRELELSMKETFLCLTVPTEGEYYLIPYEDVETQVKVCKWSRPHLEVNIDRVRSQWRELGWDINSYKKNLIKANGGTTLGIKK